MNDRRNEENEENKDNEDNEDNEEGGTEKGPATATAKPPMRESLIAAAFRLFLERGFEATTIDDIVTLAGVGRRSFFRYFPSKEDVVFPDHERCLADMTRFLDARRAVDDPVARVCEAAQLVMRMYAENPTFSIQRYRLTKSVPGLRAYELSVVWRYERALAAYLQSRFAGRPDGKLRADVIAAAVVAAHNNALRTWLRSGGSLDAAETVDHALDFVRQAWGEPRPGPLAEAPPAEPRAADARHSGTADGASRQEDMVVLIARRGTPMWRVVREIESALGQPAPKERH